MQPNNTVDSNTVLTYSLVTSPMPVQVSTSTPPASDATLTFVVSCPRPVPGHPAPSTANVAQISIILPVDVAGQPPDPTNLAETAPLPSSASISSSGSDQWEVTPGHAGVFTFTPKGGPVQVSAQSLTIVFTGIQVNTIVGTAVVRVNEWAVLGTGAPPPTSQPPSGTAGFAVAKFPYGFYAGNFTADQPMVNDQGTVTLSWVGSTNATYKLYYGTTNEDVSNLRTWPSPPLSVNTTFILRVSAQVDGQTATIDFGLTIQVLNPSFTATDLTVLTTSTLEGAVTVGQSSANAPLTVNGNVSSTGNVSAGGNVSATGNVSAGGTLTAQGNITGNGTLTLPGGWVFSVDSSGNLNLSCNGTMQFQISPTGGATIAGQSLTLGQWLIAPTGPGDPNPSLGFGVGTSPGISFDSMGNLTSGTQKVICDQDPIGIYENSRSSYLNGTSRFGGTPDSAAGWTATAYWMSTPPDVDSNLKIVYGSIGSSETKE